MRRRGLMLALALAASGCGGEQANPSPAPVLPPPPPSIPDMVDLEEDDDFLDGAAAFDSLTAPEADTLAAAEPVRVPSFDPFLREFKAALQNGRARAFAAPGLAPEALRTLADDPAVQQQVLAAGADRYRRDGTLREVYVVVGYDAAGNVVPEDEAVTESAVGLVFDVVDGEYRLVRIDRAG